MEDLRQHNTPDNLQNLSDSFHVWSKCSAPCSFAWYQILLSLRETCSITVSGSQWKAVAGDCSRRNDPGGIVAVAFPSSRLPQCLLWPWLACTLSRLDGSREAPRAFTPLCSQERTHHSWTAAPAHTSPLHPTACPPTHASLGGPCVTKHGSAMQILEELVFVALAFFILMVICTESEKKKKTLRREERRISACV